MIDANVSTVVFAIGSRPHLTTQEAIEFAELVARRLTLAALMAAGLIRMQAELDEEARTEIVLDDEELGELFAFLREPRNPQELESFSHLRAEIAAELDRR